MPPEVKELVEIPRACSWRRQVCSPKMTVAFLSGHRAWRFWFWFLDPSWHCSLRDITYRWPSLCSIMSPESPVVCIHFLV